MDEDSKQVVPMTPIGKTVEELLERLTGDVEAEDPCPVCLGTGTELLIENGVTLSRRCRHIG